MKLYLAGAESWAHRLKPTLESFLPYKPYILNSYYYVRSSRIEEMLPYYEDYFLDSGAFTMMYSRGGQKDKINLDEYIERYADFVKRYRVTRFLELDIDLIVGLEKVKELRHRLERLSGMPCIPVWHKGRGKEDFLRMCDEYSYVAIGGIHEEIKQSEYKYFPWFINEAHKRGAKIHALGFTDYKGMKAYHFDSVDSASWIYGVSCGNKHTFNGQRIVIQRRPKGHRANNKLIAEWNFRNWIKFQQYALCHF